jgi:hypothetical protein
MDVATLYMIVTFKDGTVHTRASRQENADYCMRAQKNLPQVLAWCIPDSWRWINIARHHGGCDLAARPEDQRGGRFSPGTPQGPSYPKITLHPADRSPPLGCRSKSRRKCA